MNASIPRRLLESREFRPLRTLARVVLRLLWRRGEERRWSREELLTELQIRGLFLGRAGLGEFEEVVAELLSAGALVLDPDDAAEAGDAGLLLPILSADVLKDVRSDSPAARRKREQRDRDRKDPDRVAARKAARHAAAPDAQSASPSTAPERSAVEPPSARDTGRDISRDTSPLSHPDVTVTGHVTSPVTVTASGGERGGGISSSSSSSFSEETRHSQGVNALAREGAPGRAPVTPVTGDVTGSVTPPVTGGVTADVTPPAASGDAAGEGPVTGQEIVNAFTEHALDRVNCVAPGRIVDRAEDLCRAHHLTRDELDTMARMAGRGELVGQDKRERTDLNLLVGGREGDGALLALWVGAARSAHAAAVKEKARAAKALAKAQRDLPYGAGPRAVSPPTPGAAPAPGRFTPPVVARAGAANDGRGRETG